MPRTTWLGRWAITSLAVLAVAAVLGMPVAHADGDVNTLIPNNKRLNDGVFLNIFTAHRQNGCTIDPRLDGRLVDAARRHTQDVLNNRDINGDVGSDGSTPQDRASTAGFTGTAAETVATNRSFAINNVEILNDWWYDPPSHAIMQDCRNTAIGVWSGNSFDRSVVVAVYGQPGA